MCNSNFPYDPRAIERAHRLGPSIPGKVRPIIVRFNHFKDREIVWKTLGHGSLPPAYNSRHVREDYPAEVEIDRSKLMPIARAAVNLKDPHTHSTPRVRLVADKLFINQQKFTVNNLDTLPDKLQPSAIFTPMNKDKAVFYTKNSPLSNHFPSAFTHKGEHFNSAEQFIMVEKARYFGDQEAVLAIMAEEEPAKQKQIGKMIKNFNLERWQASAQDVILPGLIAKFEQCRQCKDMLIKTEARDLVEANPHHLFFGVGVSLHSPSVWDSSSYKGKNIMGKMLQVVRRKILV